MDSAVVLPNAIIADNPLLDKFQKTLRDHLLRINEQLEKETSEIDSKIHILNGEREEIGSNLYDLQEEIERQKNDIDSLNNSISDIFEKRIKYEEETRQSKHELNKIEENHKNAKQMHKERLVALNKLQMIERKIDKWQQEMQHDLKVSKLILNKDKQEKDRICKEKRQVDFLLLNLEMEVLRREVEANEILDQIKANEQQMNDLNCKLADANIDLDALQCENRRLISSWNEVIQAISNRDKLLARTNDGLIKETEHVNAIQTDIDATKKEIFKQMEQNENLEQFKQRIIDDLNHLNMQYNKATQEQTLLIDKLEKSTNLLNENESSLHKSTVENHILDGNLKSLRREYESQTENKIKHENQILEMLQAQVTTDHASKIRGRNIYELRNKRRDLELIMNNTEAQLSEILFELEKLKGVLIHSKSHADDLKTEQILLETRAEEYDKELIGIKKSIDLKLNLSDRLNKQLAKLIEAAGGKENDPLHLQVRDLEMTITELEIQIKNDQNDWLRLQNNIVQLSERLTEQMNDSHLAKQQLLVIEQKTLKINTELNDIEKQDENIERDIRNLNTKLDILSAKLFDKKQNMSSEKEQCQFMHINMLDKLRYSELSVIQLENELKNISNEIDNLKRTVLDRHYEALSWETKWKMIEEAKRQYDVEHAKSGEINAMKSEIHRMEVRFNELKRAQEKLVSDMELCVHHRGHIFDQANIRSKLPQNKSKSIDTMQYRVNEIQSKLKQILSEIAAISKQTNNVLTIRESVEHELNKMNHAIDAEREQYVLLQNEIEQAILLKQNNLEAIVRLQNRVKKYQSVVKAIQIPKNHNESTIDAALHKNDEINKHLNFVLENLLVEFSDQKFAIQRIRQTLSE